MRSRRSMLAAGVAALALAPAPAGAQAPDCLPSGERIPEPTRDGYGLGPVLPAPACPPADPRGTPGGPGGATGGLPGLIGTPPDTGGTGVRSPLSPLTSTPGAPGRGAPPGTDGESGGDAAGGGGPSDQGAPGGGGPPSADPSVPGGPAGVLGDLLNADEGVSLGGLAGIPPTKPAWVGPLAGARGLSLLDLAVGAGLLIALAMVATRLAQPGP